MAFKGFQGRTQDENRKPHTAGASAKDPRRTQDENRKPVTVGASVKDPPAVHKWPTPQPSAFHRNSRAQSNNSTYTTASKEAPSHNSQSAHFSKRYPCSFKGCGRRFDEKASLVKHKDSEHDYCLPCDIDFVDDEALHVHKMQSTMHIICPICGIDFKSEPGRDRHAKQMHATQQNVECRGCHKTFPKGAALLLHFETNQCAPLKAYNNPDEQVHQKDMLEAQRALMAVELSMQQQEDTRRGPWPSTTQAGTESIISDSADGGVRLQPSLMDDPVSEQSHGMGNLQPALLAFPDSSDTASMASTSTVQGHGGNWPVVGSTFNGKSKAEGTGRRMSVQSAGPWSNEVFPNASNSPMPADTTAPSAKYTAASLDSRAPSESGINSVPSGRLLQPDGLDNIFHCPFPKCEQRYLLKDALIVHIKTHTGIQNRCPCCSRNFKTPSALTAHMESASTRCNIRETKGYGNIISLVSGGFLGVSGKFEDGTVKMDSQKKPDSFW